VTIQRRLLLIKHSLPEPIAGLDAHHWRLSEAGRDRCIALANRLTRYAPTIIVTSQEPKARETADIVGRALGLSVESAPDLQEHDRTGVPWLGQEQFETSVRAFFDHPDERVFGRETADQAAARFSGAVDAIVARRRAGTIAIVSHGTVISLYVAAKTGDDPITLWQRLGLPSLVVLALPSRRLIEVVDSV
jgi:broad specificity phosphatase PhoE